jgi:hypothetical protein
MLRSVIEAAVHAGFVWSVVDFIFPPVPYINGFWIFAAIQAVGFLGILFARLPPMDAVIARASIVVHAGVILLSLWQALLFSIVPSVLLVAAIAMISPWTHKEPDWLHPSLFVASLFFVFLHHVNRKKAIQARGEWIALS